MSCYANASVDMIFLGLIICTVTLTAMCYLYNTKCIIKSKYHHYKKLYRTKSSQYGLAGKHTKKPIYNTHFNSHQFKMRVLHTADAKRPIEINMR